MTEQRFQMVNEKGEILTYEQFLAVKEDLPGMTVGMVRNYGRADAPTWGAEGGNRGNTEGS